MGPLDDLDTPLPAEPAQPPPQTSVDLLHWDGSGAVSRSLRLIPASELGMDVAERVSPAAAGLAPSQAVSTPSCVRIPSLPVPVIDWATEALRLTFYLDPVLLLPSRPPLLPKVTGTLVWVHGQANSAGLLPAPRPVLLVETPGRFSQAARVELVFHLALHDPLLHHMASVLQSAIEAAGDLEQLYAEVLADALVAHCFSRYHAGQFAQHEVRGGLTPYTLQHTLTYIKAHLDQKMSIATLAAAAQMSPTHFAHLFKHSTGLAPHQYVSRSRMEQAKHLLVETDMPLIEIAHQVGCADQSHFTALFRVHTALTPKAYRNATRHAGQAVATRTNPDAPHGLSPGGRHA